MKPQILSLVFVISLALVSFSTPATVQCEPGTTPIFEVEDAALEGITVTKDGTIYASGDVSGKIFKRTTDGNVSEVASFWNDESGVVLGLTSDPSGNVYANVNHWFDESIHGIWQIGPDDSVELYATLPLGSLLNGITIDKNGNLYVSDSYGGSIWKVSKKGEVELWVQDDLLMDSLGFGFGINGVAYYHHAIYAAITLDGRIVKVPINLDGSAGVPENYFVDDALFGADDVILDRFGNLYVANVFMHSIIMVDNQLVVTTLIENSEDVFKPASLSLGARGDQFSIFFTNYENANDWPPPDDPKEVADVTRLDLCPPGLQE
jgi:sugar lactone lactonase YvrE